MLGLLGVLVEAILLAADDSDSDFCGLASLMLIDDDDIICFSWFWFRWLMIMTLVGWFEYGDCSFEELIVDDDVI